MTRKALEVALDGDTVALRLCLERILPPRRGRPVHFALPALQSPADASAAMAAIGERSGSAFFDRCRRDVLGMDEPQARADMEAVWQPNAIWAALVARRSE